MESKVIGNRIKELMTIEKIDKKELADSLDLTMLELEKKLNGEEEFYISQMINIKKIFHLNLEAFTKLFFEEDFDLEGTFTNLYK